MKHLIRYCFFTIFFSVATTSCFENVESPVPDFPVHLELNLVSTYPNFKGPNQFLIFEKRVLETDRIGYAGVIVYNGFDNNYYAFDMCCPYEVKASVKVYPNDIGQAVCHACGTVYDISYGVGCPVSGPCKEVLKRYKTSLSGNVLYITR